MSNRSYWVGVVSREHVQIGVAGGFIQLNHGKRAPLQKMRAGDGLLMYSPKVSHPDGANLQAFTAIGQVLTGEIYQVEMNPEFKPYRINVNFLACQEAAIRPLIDALTCIYDKAHWGAAFRFGQLSIPQSDFALIAAAMQCDSFPI